MATEFTFDDAAAAAAAGIPSKPTTWSLTPGERYLKGKQELVSDADDGVISAEKTRAENDSWYYILSRFIAKYNVSTWNTEPPYPLQQIWDLLASSIYLTYVQSRHDIISEEAAETPTRWREQADELMQRYIDPRRESQRAHLIASDGSVLAPRTDHAVPVLASSGVTFFPNTSQDASHGRATDQNMETLYKKLT